MKNNTQRQNNMDNPRHVAEAGSKNGTTKNRNRAAVAAIYAEATNAMTFTEADDVTDLTLVASAVTGEAIQDDTSILIIYDGLNEATEIAMFADVGSIDSDVEYKRILAKDLSREVFASYLTRIAFLPSKPLAITTVGQ